MSNGCGMPGEQRENWNPGGEIRSKCYISLDARRSLS